MKQENIEETTIDTEVKEEENPWVPAPEGCLYAEYDENYKIDVINQVEAFNRGLPIVEFEIAYDGQYYVKGHCPEKPLPTNKEQSEKRSVAYQNEVDPITAHIQRLRDEEQTEEMAAEIEELKIERSTKVEEIKERYPYYENQLEAE